jgi:glycosyltransferase involved in cell wall biosynthesis
MSQTTVIIPCYNGEAYLGEALTSVSAQASPPLEILVIDDGSKTPVVYPDNWVGPPLRIIRTENRGLAAARNLGVREAKGEYVAFLDCDDWWAPTKLALQEAQLNQHPEAVASYTQCVDQPGCYGFGPYPPDDISDADFALMLWYNAFFPPSSVLARRQTVVDVGCFREGMLNGEDLELFFRLLRRGPFLQVALPLTFYRQHAGQLTGNVVRKLLGMKQARFAMIADHQQQFAEWGLPNHLLWDAYRNDILAVYFRRDFQAARVLLFDFARQKPSDWKIWVYALISRLPASWISRWRGQIPQGVGNQPGGNGANQKRSWQVMLQSIKDVTKQ